MTQTQKWSMKDAHRAVIAAATEPTISTIERLERTPACKRAAGIMRTIHGMPDQATAEKYQAAGDVVRDLPMAQLERIVREFGSH